MKKIFRKLKNIFVVGGISIILFMGCDYNSIPERFESLQEEETSTDSVYDRTRDVYGRLAEVCLKIKTSARMNYESSINLTKKGFNIEDTLERAECFRLAKEKMKEGDNLVQFSDSLWKNLRIIHKLSPYSDIKVNEHQRDSVLKYWEDSLPKLEQRFGNVEIQNSKEYLKSIEESGRIIF